jgi:2,6-dihydroxypseudooxynicotine hydrolase
VIELQAGQLGDAQAGPRDGKILEAVTAWRPRFAIGGIDYGQIEGTLARIEDWTSWCEEWGRTARHYEELAEDAEVDGRMETAASAWRQAFRCWHFGKFVFTESEDAARTANDRAVACYKRGAWALRPPAQKVSIPYGDALIPGYLRIPEQLLSHAPLVLMIVGLDSVKEEMEVPGEYFLSRGMAVLAIDGPGQGEMEECANLEPHFESVVEACLDWVQKSDGFRTTRFGLYGRSLGGYFACRGAAFDDRVGATVSVSGPYCFADGWDTRGQLSRSAFQRRSGAADGEDAKERAALFTLEGVAPRIRRPLLVIHGARDRIIRQSAAERIASEACDAELKVYADGLHGLTNYPFEALSYAADWMAQHLRG